MSLVYGLDRSPNGFGAFSMVLDLSQFSAPLHPPSLIPSNPGRSHQRRITRRAPSDSPRGVPHCIVRSNDILHARKGREQSPHCKAPPDSPSGDRDCIHRRNDVLHARKGRNQSRGVRNQQLTRGASTASTFVAAHTLHTSYCNRCHSPKCPGGHPLTDGWGSRSSNRSSVSCTFGSSTDRHHCGRRRTHNGGDRRPSLRRTGSLLASHTSPRGRRRALQT